MNRDIFQAIADPTRRKIIVLMGQSVMTPNTLAQHFDCSRQAISKHIKILTECGVIVVFQQGREHYISINFKKLSEIDAWLEPFREMWEDKFDRLDSLLVQQNKR